MGETVKLFTVKDDGETIDRAIVNIDIEYGYQVSEGRALRFRTMVPQDAPVTEHEAVLQKMSTVAALAGLKEALVEHRRELANAEKRLGEIDDPEKRKSEIGAELEALAGGMEAKRAEFAAAYRASGRAGKWKPEGREKSELDLIQRDIDKLRDEVKTAVPTIERQRADLQKAMKNWTVAIENVETEIRIRRDGAEV